MPASRVRTLSYRGRTPIGSMASIRGATPEASMTASNVARSRLVSSRGSPPPPSSVGAAHLAQVTANQPGAAPRQTGPAARIPACAAGSGTCAGTPP
jgi:hypothetical protein